MNQTTLKHADRIMRRIEKYSNDDYLAFLSVALDETSGDVVRSIAVADECCNERAAQRQRVVGLLESHRTKGNK
jgi:hypothetical protein